MIEVKLFAYFRENRGKVVFVDYYEGIKVKDIVSDLNIELDDVSIILVNGRHQTLETILNDGQKLFLFPPVGGG
ncbi:MoaD/ThiS family protein [Erysipelotrichaceae bacterium OttesenSCG-928-M19]|nr:MoaD/ThiS family protein [Erysipelotrichaceae bacterium OttesenSCG-928-M19]